MIKERQAPTTRLIVSKDGRRRVDGEWPKVPEEEEERDVTDSGRQEGQAERLAQDTVIVEIVKGLSCSTEFEKEELPTSALASEPKNEPITNS